MLAEVTALGCAGTVGELIRRAVQEGRWRAGIEKDVQHLKDELARVESSAAKRITKAQDESATTADQNREALAKLTSDISDIKVAIARIEAALGERK